MPVTTLSFENLHQHGELFVKFLRARREAFIGRNHWDLLEAGGMEYDQYDTPASRWIVVHEDGEVQAGIRLTPTTARCGIYSYMIRDAQRGLLDGIPDDLLSFEAPVDPDIWESSRVFVMSNVAAKMRTRVQAAMMMEMIRVAKDCGAKLVIGLVPAVWSRWIGRLGLEAAPAGPELQMDGWRTQVAMMTLEARADEIASVASEKVSKPANNGAHAASAELATKSIPRFDLPSGRSVGTASHRYANTNGKSSEKTWTGSQRPIDRPGSH